MTNRLNNGSEIDFFAEQDYSLDNINNSEFNKSNNYNNLNFVDSITKIYLDEVDNIPLLTSNEEHELLVKIANGDKKARKRIIEANLYLVIRIAKTMIGRGLHFLDLIEEGNIGLINATDTFQVDNGLCFSTYAVLLIYRQLCNAIYSQSRNIRLPNGFYSQVLKCKKLQKELKNKLGHEPTVEQIAEKIGISLKRAKLLLKWQLDTISIYSPISDNKNEEIVDFICDDDSIEDLVITKMDFFTVKNMFGILNKNEITFLNLRFGLEDGKERSYEEVGNYFNVTRECARLTENRILDKIRSEFKKRKLNYLKTDDLKKYEVKFNKKKNIKKSCVKRFVYRRKNVDNNE